MKKASAIILFVILILSVSIPSFAQNSRARTIVPLEFAQYERMTGFTDGRGTLVRWSMKTETSNLGFFLYRVGDQGLELVNPVMVMSSGAKVSTGIAYGETYEVFDVQGRLNSSYVIESMATDGRRVRTDPFYSQFTTNFEGDTGHPRSFYTNKERFKNGNLRSDNLALPSDLQSIVTGSVQAPNPAMQRELVTQPGVKIGVKKEGMYRVTRAELETAGFDVNSSSANWRLFVDGNEQAMIVGDGDQYIEFYGKGIDVRETDTRTYYLIADSVAGKRMITKFLGSIGGNVMSNNYRLSTEKKERITYYEKIKNGDLENYWGRPVISSPAANVTFDLTSIDLSSSLDAVITVKLQGFQAGQHAALVTVNGHEMGIVSGSNLTSFSADFSVPPSFLLEGTNTLTLASTTSNDVTLFDSVRVNYSRKYQADQNSVIFFTPGYRKIDVGGFGSPSIRVFDTTLDGNAQLVTDLPIIQNGSTFSVKMPSNRPAVFFAVEDSALLHPASITFDNPSDLVSTTNTADFIIISYSSPEFMAGAETWANYRRSPAGGGFTVKVVDVDDIYDEFSYGAHSGSAVNHFLEYAYNNWQSPKPKYLLILGDASYDPRNYLGIPGGPFDLVPTKWVDLIYETTGADEALADFLPHDGLAEMAVGRIPARTSSVITTAFNKTTGFEVPEMQTLDRGALCAFDIPIGFDFDAMCHVLMHQLPARTPITYIQRGLPEPNPNHLQDPAARPNLLAELNTGKYVANYSGHGSTGSWSGPGFFSVDDPQHLTNANRQTIFTMLTCFNGLFARPDADSLGEALLKTPNGGAVAAWASATETTPDYQLTMGLEFFHQLGLNDIKRLGDLIIKSKATIAGSDVGYSWVLLGDPALKVKP